MKFMTALNRPFEAFAAAVIGLKGSYKKSECKANHQHQWSKVFQLHFLIDSKLKVKLWLLQCSYWATLFFYSDFEW